MEKFREELNKIKAKPRKDDRLGPRTRIPMPRDVKLRLQKEGGDTVPPSDLKRFDSGVDITNFSPTDNSIQGEEDQCMAWQGQSQAVAVTVLAPQQQTIPDSDDYF